MTATELPAAAYRELVNAPIPDYDEMSSEEYRRLFGQTASDLVPRSKYGNQPTEVDGHRFDSLAEARRYRDLTRLRDAGEISQLRLQPKFPIVVNGMAVCVYVADFSYIGSTGVVVEDVKSSATRKNRSYQLKRKLMLAVHGIEISEVER